MARGSRSKKATADRGGVWSTARQDGTPAPTESGDKELTDGGATGEGAQQPGWGMTRRELEGGRRARGADFCGLAPVVRGQ